ncbi:T9SS type A sorting domain-containing protein [Patiriisocius hiemis]|uniref:T9SS type A sorting domain-containing protein n=1 Tax=Patiriisocius hiemis TaxID=3075604 RepID=A0ABU2YF55_9FLAO|nr:T9SS type A sorting domain-containing protein [Constantimarinum sp. W242]MDT0556382.1 T9SS type A sorting domain-containing protein [Constantimarinum sp. W242]
MKKITLLLALLTASFSFGQIVINEVDADQTSTDTTEFIELLSDTPNFNLNGYIVVLYNGSSDESYTTVDLSGFTTDGNGYLIIGSDAVPGVDIPLGPDNTIQNGADAIAIYQDNAANFPNGTPVTNTNLIDALVYGTGDPDDTDLLTALGETVQYDENANGMKDTESIQRNPADGTYCVGLPTLRATNINCSTVCALSVFVDDVTCDAVTAGTDTYTTTLNFTGGGTETYTIVTTAGTVSGDNPSSTASGSIIISGVNEGTDFTYTITSALCNISNTITSPACDPGTNVADIATLRGSLEGEVYTLTGEAILTFQQDFRNQKFIEDATGAILIDDSGENITTSYELGDGISGITGTLSSFNGMLQFVPTLDPGTPSSTGNQIDPQVVSMADLTANPGNYESELVQIQQEVTIDNSASSTWDVGTVYPLTNAGGSFNFRTTFFDVNYIGSDVPANAVLITGIITEREDDGGYYITSRNADEASSDVTLGVDNVNTIGFTMYPNPTNQGFVNIESTSTTGEIQVAVYNVIGKQVINTSIINRLDVSALTSGIYLVKITQENASVTKKLVIK